MQAKDEAMAKSLAHTQLKADAFRNVLCAMTKSGLDSELWSRTFDEETQRLSMDRTLGDLPWPDWMIKHRHEQRIREAKEMRV